MKTDKTINGRTVRKSAHKGLWDVMEQKAGRLTGKVEFTGTLTEIRRALKGS